MAFMRHTPPQGELRRYHRRVPVVWSGSFGHGKERVDCAILNLSKGGAKVRIPDPNVRPTQLALESPHFGEFLGRVVWRDGNVMGLSFDSAPEAMTTAVGQDFARHLTAA